MMKNIMREFEKEESFEDEPKVLMVGNCGQGLAAACVLGMAGMVMSYHPEGWMPFDPPLSRLPETKTIEKTTGDRDRLLKAAEKRELKRLKALKNQAKTITAIKGKVRTQ